MRLHAALTAVAVVLATFGVDGVSAAGDAGKSRTERGEYQSPEPSLIPYHPYGLHVCNQGGAAGSTRGCVTFRARLNERFVRVRIEDLTGLQAPAYLQFGSDNSDHWIPFCGDTGKRIRVLPGTEFSVRVFAYRSPNLPLCPGTATTGSVVATFWRK